MPRQRKMPRETGIPCRFLQILSLPPGPGGSTTASATVSVTLAATATVAATAAKSSNCDFVG